MLDFCANRIMALQELQATGTLAVGFKESGCYQCDGHKKDCPFLTPMAWVYESEESIPDSIRIFIRRQTPPS